MRAIEEIKYDLFLKSCKLEGLTYRKGIIEKAESEPKIDVELVDEMMRSGDSVIFDHSLNDCKEHGNLFYDSKNEEYYCPVCEL